jgi:hypothetical protein
VHRAWVKVNGLLWGSLKRSCAFGWLTEAGLKMRKRPMLWLGASTLVLLRGRLLLRSSSVWTAEAVNSLRCPVELDFELVAWDISLILLLFALVA